ncbi:MAG: DUF1311 domain-containing protein, partial [Neisseriaceae bacterium]|nr:DUF1311 domain-containing protein [Neisseriaceae bacterium]
TGNLNSKLGSPNDDIEFCISEICNGDNNCVINRITTEDVNLIGYSKEYDKCMEGKLGDNQMIACVNEEYAKQDKMLNQKYKKIMKLLPDDEKILLKNYQKKWVKTKKIISFCNAPTNYSLGTMHYLTEAMERLALTNERVNQFEQCLSAKKISRNSKGCENLYPLK